MFTSRLSRELALLEGEVALTLLDPTISATQRTELEERLNAIRAKMPAVRPAPAPVTTGPIDDDEQ